MMEIDRHNILFVGYIFAYFLVQMVWVKILNMVNPRLK